MTDTSIRTSHPNLYRSIMVFALISIGLGLNFIFTNPTFNPYGVDKLYVGIVFLLLGLSKIVFLHIYFNLRRVRIAMSIEIIFFIFWGAGSIITFFQGKTSLQLFCLYAGLAMIELFALIEPSYNPLSSTKESDVRLE